MKKKVIIILSIVLVVIAAGVIIIGAGVKLAESNLKKLATLQIENIDLSGIEDGTYKGGYTAFPVSVEVSVAVKGNRIESVSLLKHRNGQGVPAEAITKRVMEKQSLAVDVVSGATYSSKVILKAIETALHNKPEPGK